MIFNIDEQHLANLSAICKAVETAGATAVAIMGGAVRDMLLGKPIKDIDVFYVLPDNPLPSLKDFNKDYAAFLLANETWKETTLDEEVLKKHFTQEKLTWEEGKDAYDCDEFEVTHGKLTLEGCFLPVQLIKVDDLVETLSKFPCGLSKVYFLDGGITMEPEFIYGAMNKILVFTEECPEEYMQRLHAKYEDFI